MEQPSTGYDFEVIGDMGKDFECPICMLLLRKAAELPCTHVFCKVCLEQWQDNPMEKNAAFLCPSCKRVYQREEVAGNKYVDKLVTTSLQVKCQENKFGCQWEGKIIDYTQHEKKCVYQSINCKFVGCKERIIVKAQEKHQLECIYRLVQCQHCLSKVQFINLQSHYGKCAEFPVICPNDGCSIMTPRKEVCNHTQNECPYQMVNCKYHAVGCQHQFQRRYTTQHQTEGLHDHMNMLLDGFNMTSQELSSVKEKLRETEEKLQETESRLQNTEGKLAITDEKHQETKIVLNQTQEELQNTNQHLNVANEAISNIRNHDHEIDQLCILLVKCNRCFYDVKLGLQSLATMDYNEIPEFNLRSPDVWSDLHKMVDEKVKLPYADRFIHVINLMETSKLYRSSEKEVFVKVELGNFVSITLKFTNYDTNQKNFSSIKLGRKKIFGMDIPERIEYTFSLPGWNDANVKTFLLNPTESTPKLLYNTCRNDINKMMMVHDSIVLLKAVLE